ncbi:MAG: NTP transferase domain-containing protein [Collinsella sp.]
MPASEKLPSALALSLGSVNAANKELTNEGLLESDSLTDNGYEALHPYKVENAVILAAGLSSRFAPISYEKPKGLLKVRGEILIERQIRQLQDAGISNITVVVGYKRVFLLSRKQVRRFDCRQQRICIQK